jgi:hypothetical protein
MDAKTLDQYRDTGVILNCQHVAQFAIRAAAGENPAPIESQMRVVEPFGVCFIVCKECLTHINATLEFLGTGAN